MDGLPRSQSRSMYVSLSYGLDPKKNFGGRIVLANEVAIVIVWWWQAETQGEKNTSGFAKCQHLRSNVGIGVAMVCQSVKGCDHGIDSQVPEHGFSQQGKRHWSTICNGSSETDDRLEMRLKWADEVTF